MINKKSILVTVGTTGFDELIREICSEAFVCLLKPNGFDSIIIQYGSSKNEYSSIYFNKYDITVKAFDYAPSLSSYLDTVDLVIGHAGAGTILGTLRKNLPLLVVVNESLMGNHQHEIADAMVDSNYVMKSTVSTLLQSFVALQHHSLNKYPEAHPESFVSYVNRQMHFSCLVC